MRLISNVSKTLGFTPPFDKGSRLTGTKDIFGSEQELGKGH